MRSFRARLRRRTLPAAIGALALAAALAGCAGAVRTTAAPGRILAVGAESQYANVLAQVGGRYVTAVAVEDNPNTDPHEFEASPSVARALAGARLVVQNGVGYDTYMNKLEAATAGGGRKVIDVQHLLGLADSTPNPHLWYLPSTMPAVAHAIAGDLARILPRHAAYFDAQADSFTRSLAPWKHALASLAQSYPHFRVAVTEPVADYMLEAAHAVIVTPFALQADIMNGVDPAPQAIDSEQRLLSGRRVSVFLYNQQVTDTLTQSFLAIAHHHRIPVVGAYETMPTGYDYQGWMLAEVAALRSALARGDSTERL
jgi:zinc/manganese transport system substrate-binding protein